MIRRTAAAALALGLVVTGLTACGKDTKDATVVVYAAASLKASFETIARDAGLGVQFNFDGSQNLVDALDNGARADVLATADQKNMDKAVAKKLVAAPTVFASNTLVIATPPDNPAKVTGLDASLGGAKLVVCAVGVPCGNATEKLARQQGATLRPVSQEQKVSDVLGKVTSGEADAGIVYATDAKGAGDKVHIVEMDGADKVVNSYPIALTASPADKDGGQRFIDAVLAADGQKVLRDAGFKVQA